LAELVAKRRTQYGTSAVLTPEERARIAEIQDLLIDRYIELKEAVQNDNEARAKNIEIEIKELHSERKEIESWANV
jgi:hypothetical protein